MSHAIKFIFLHEVIDILHVVHAVVYCEHGIIGVLIGNCQCGIACTIDVLKIRALIKSDNRIFPCLSYNKLFC